MKNNEGFTLIELLTGVAAAALVTFGAISLLLLGVRVQHSSVMDVEEQQQVRIALTLLEEMMGSGKISAVRITCDGWELLAPGSEQVRFTYVASEQVLYSAAADERTPLLTGVRDATVDVEDGQSLHVSLETTRGVRYTTTVFCRMGITENLQ